MIYGTIGDNNLGVLYSIILDLGINKLNQIMASLDFWIAYGALLVLVDCDLPLLLCRVERKAVRAVILCRS